MNYPALTSEISKRFLMAFKNQKIFDEGEVSTQGYKNMEKQNTKLNSRIKLEGKLGKINFGRKAIPPLFQSRGILA